MFDKTICFNGALIKKSHVSAVHIYADPADKVAMTIYLGRGCGLSINKAWSDLDPDATIGHMVSLLIDLLGKRDTIRLLDSIKKKEWIGRRLDVLSWPEISGLLDSIKKNLTE